MYIIVNRTTRQNTNHADWPHHRLIELLEKGDDLIIISKYSNTIKVPYQDQDSNNHGETKSSRDWEFKDYYL
jgi:hypothetical protein